MDGLTNYRIRKHDAHNKYFNKGSVVDVQPQFPVEITTQSEINGEKVQWIRSLNSANGRDSISNTKELTSIAIRYQERIRNGDTNLVLPIISYYGIGRLWNQHREKRNNTFKKSTRSNGYLDSLDGAANDKFMMKWFQEMTIQQYQKGQILPEFKAVCLAMEQCFQSISGYQNVKVQFNLDTHEIDLMYLAQDNNFKTIPLSQLSDGYKCTISLVADIAYRMAILNLQLLEHVLTETDGIVLINEIDLHLHPSWQQKILTDLMKIFPKVQFIVTTHAPAVINSVGTESLMIIKDKEILCAPDETYGKDVNTIFREVMGVSERPEDVQMLFSKFYNFLDNKNFVGAEAALDSLETILGNNDTKANSCRVRLELERL